VLEPQGTALFFLLIAVFCSLVGWLVLARQLVFRVLAAHGPPGSVRTAAAPARPPV
jgi:hypothetical protein